MTAAVTESRIGTVSGIALVPGVSRNGRLYTAEAIGKAVARAQERIADGEQPLTMLTHHAADDDSTQIVGRITAMEQDEDGRARYVADLADTGPARTIASLVDTRSGTPFLRGVSIRGAWVGKVRSQPGPDGTPVETADDLELDGLDFTRKPGVLGARVDSFTPAGADGAEEAASERMLITESVQEALVQTTINEADSEATASGSEQGPFADPGYQKDKQKRYDLSTKARAKAAWSYIGQADNACLYTAAQLKRIKQRIVKALKAFGVTVAAQEGWLIDPAAEVTEALAECWGMDAADAGNLYVSLTNGPTTVTVSSYSLDPHDLDAVGRAAMAGACQALLGIDPDMDGDVDIPGEPNGDAEPGSAAGAVCPCGCGCAIPETPGNCPCECESCAHCKTDEDDVSSDDAMESLPAAVAGEPVTAGHWALLHESGLLAPGVYVTAALINEALTLKAAAAAVESSAPEVPDAETTPPEEEPAMAEPNTAAETAAAPAAGGVHLSDDQFQQLLARFAPQPAAAAPVETAPAEPVAETATRAPEPVAVTETEDQRIERLVAEGIKAALPHAVQEHVEATGGPARKGLVTPVAETGTAPASGIPEGWPQKPLHEYTDEEFRQYASPATVNAILGTKAASS
ncbi:DUF6582 domain-containing protein [Streptomyces sp. NPDC059994]|uniref:DUF6582 domain-containing protein n=1 Tax=Streptomyces sp. NPDC059994 TaxID=3347029 RepID=UPI0036BE9373